MIKEEEIEYYRNNIINRYVTPIMRELAIEEQKEERLKRFEQINQFKKSKNRSFEQTNQLKSTLDYKKCSRCGKVKPLTEFYKNPLKFKGVFDYCKECAKKRQREIRYEKKNNNNNR